MHACYLILIKEMIKIYIAVKDFKPAQRSCKVLRNFTRNFFNKFLLKVFVVDVQHWSGSLIELRNSSAIARYAWVGKQITGRKISGSSIDVQEFKLLNTMEVTSKYR